eukprot:gene9964-11014_t
MQVEGWWSKFKGNLPSGQAGRPSEPVAKHNAVVPAPLGPSASGALSSASANAASVNETTNRSLSRVSSRRQGWVDIIFGYLMRSQLDSDLMGSSGHRSGGSNLGSGMGRSRSGDGLDHGNGMIGRTQSGASTNLESSGIGRSQSGVGSSYAEGGVILPAGECSPMDDQNISGLRLPDPVA